MITGVLAAAAIFGVVALTLLLIFRKDVVGVDLGARGLLRLYLYVASLAGVVVTVIGVATLLDWASGNVFGVQAIYGRVPSQVDPNFMPSNLASQQTLQFQTDLLRGLTLTIFGAAFWGAHRMLRRTFGADDERSSLLHRAHDVLGTFVFGAGVLVLLPVGIYQALSYALITPAPDVFQPGFGDSLAGGIVSAPVWLVYLYRVIRSVPRREATPQLRTAAAHLT